MAWWHRLVGRGEPEQRLGTLGADGWPLGGFLGAPTGPVAPAAAEGLSAFLGGIQLISSALASLPATLTVDTPDGPQPAPPSSPAWRLLRRPNRWQSWPAFIEWLTAQILLQGNGCAAIQVDGRGAVTALLPTPWQWLNPQVITGAGGQARLVYDVVAQGPESALLNLPRRLLDDEALHVRSRSDTGIIGRSVLSRAAGPVREGLAIADLAAKNWANGLRTSGVISLDGALKDASRERLRERLDSFKSSDTLGVLILDQNAKFSQMQLSSVDAEFLSTRAFSVAETCRMLNIPEPLLQIGQRAVADLAPFTTALAQQCLAPLVATITAEFDEQVLNGEHLVLDLDGLSRGSFATTVAALCALLQSGAIVPDEARGELGWPPIDGGDVLRPGNAPSWPADFKGGDHLGASPGPKPASGLAEPGSHHGEGAGGRKNGKTNGATPP